MLKLMREKATSLFIKILLGAIVVVFVFWGVGSFRSQRSGNVARVNGQPITVEEYRQTYNNLMEQVRQRFGNNLNDEMIKMLQLKEQAIDLLINQKLLLQEADKINFRVTDTELSDAIRKIAAFQIDGVFDSRRYRDVLNRNRLTPEAFEVMQREFMLMEKLKSVVSGSVKVSDQEANEWYQWNNALVNIDFVLFDPESYKDIKPSGEEIKSFFEAHKEEYKTEPKIKVRYLHFAPEAYTSKISITDEDVTEYYRENQEEFKTPATVEARHILIRVDRNAGPDAVEKARVKAQDILNMAVKEGDFAKLAKQYSECPSKDKGGDLGQFTRESMVKPFADKAFSMKAGEISDPVRTQFGWHLIKVEKVNEETILSRDEASPGIRQKLISDKTRNLAYDEAVAVYDASVDGDDLVKTASARNLKLLTTDFFTRKGPDKGVKNPLQFASAAFNLSVMEISDIQELGDGYYILQVIEKIAGKVPELKEVEEQVVADLIKVKQNQKAKNDANDFLVALKTGKSISDEAKKLNLNVNTTGFFDRNSSIPHIGYERKITEAAFKLSKEGKNPENVVKGKKGYYVIALKERKKPETEGFEKEKTKIKKKLIEQKKSRAFAGWVSQIRERSEISIEKDFLN